MALGFVHMIIIMHLTGRKNEITYSIKQKIKLEYVCCMYITGN